MSVDNNTVESSTEAGEKNVATKESSSTTSPSFPERYRQLIKLRHKSIRSLSFFFVGTSRIKMFANFLKVRVGSHVSVMEIVMIFFTKIDVWPSGKNYLQYSCSWRGKLDFWMQGVSFAPPGSFSRPLWTMHFLYLPCYLRPFGVPARKPLVPLSSPSGYGSVSLTAFLIIFFYFRKDAWWNCRAWYPRYII